MALGGAEHTCAYEVVGFRSKLGHRKLQREDMDNALKAVEAALDNQIEPWINALERAGKAQRPSFQRELGDLGNDLERQRGNLDEIDTSGNQYYRLFKKYLTRRIAELFTRLDLQREQQKRIVEKSGVDVATTTTDDLMNLPKEVENLLHEAENRVVELESMCSSVKAHSVSSVNMDKVNFLRQQACQGLDEVESRISLGTISSDELVSKARHRRRDLLYRLEVVRLTCEALQARNIETNNSSEKCTSTEQEMHAQFECVRSELQAIEIQPPRNRNFDHIRSLISRLHHIEHTLSVTVVEAEKHRFYEQVTSCMLRLQHLLENLDDNQSELRSKGKRARY